MHQVFCFHKLYCITTSSNILKDSILTSTCTNKASRVEFYFVSQAEVHVHVYIFCYFESQKKMSFSLVENCFHEYVQLTVGYIENVHGVYLTVSLKSTQYISE